MAMGGMGKVTAAVSGPWLQVTNVDLDWLKQ